MEVSGQLQASAALPPGKDPPVANLTSYSVICTSNSETGAAPLRNYELISGSIPESHDEIRTLLSSIYAPPVYFFAGSFGSSGGCEAKQS